MLNKLCSMYNCLLKKMMFAIDYLVRQLYFYTARDKFHFIVLTCNDLLQGHKMNGSFSSPGAKEDRPVRFDLENRKPLAMRNVLIVISNSASTFV